MRRQKPHPSGHLLRAGIALMSLFCWLATSATAAAAFSPTINDAMVQVTATGTMSASGTSVTLTWTKTGTPYTSGTQTAYTINRRVYNSSTNGYAYTQIAAISGTSPNNYTDTTVVPGTIYEYQIANNGDAKWTIYPIYGFVTSGVGVPLPAGRGTIDLLLDQTISASCAPRLTRLIQDLIGDGWKVIWHNVARDTNELNIPDNNVTTSGSITAAIRATVMSDYQAHPDLAAVLIFGHVAIPFTGYEIPDGHYYRAMPCDGFYGDMGDNNPASSGTWSDTAISQSNNLPNNLVGDGRWDVNTYSGGNGITTRQLMVGRVDFADLPSFTSGTEPGMPLSETQLLNRYLDKDHNYRNARLIAQRQAFTTTNLDYYRNVLRTFYTYFGVPNVSNIGEGPMWSTITGSAANPYLFAYAGCSGATDSTTGISTADMTASDYKVIFTFAGASHMEEWWSDDNALRAMLAMPTYTLTCGWSDYSSDWQFDRFAMGFPIGASLQSGSNQYPSDAVYTDDPESDYNQYSTVWTALMGDPTLYMYVVTPPSNVSASPSGLNTVITWVPSPDSNIAGYNVYRGTDLSGSSAFTQLNGSLVTGTSYTDTTLRVTNVYYMVRAVHNETRGTGLYQNASQGQFVALSLSGSTSQTPTAFSLSGTVNENGAVPTSLPVTLSGSDPGDNPLLYSIVINPSHGTLTGTAPNLTYTPAIYFSGTDSFSYVVNNGLTDSAPATVNLTVPFVAQPPIVYSAMMTAYRYNGWPNEVYLSGSDVQGWPLSYRVVTPPAYGTVTITGTPTTVTTGTGTITGSTGSIAQYTPNAGFTGTDSFAIVSNNTVLDAQMPATVTVIGGTDGLIPTGPLVAYWKFDGTTPVDSGTAGLNGTLKNGATISGTAGISGGALSTTGSTQYCGIPSIPVFAANYVPTMTVSFWFNANNISQNGTQVIMDMDGSQVDQTLSVYIINSTLYIHAGTLNTQFHDTITSGSATITSNTWHHLAITLEGLDNVYLPDRITAYLDGVMIGRVPAESFYRFDTGSGDWGIGGVNSSTVFDGQTFNAAAPNDGFNGYVDEVRLYSVRLQPAQIHAILDQFNFPSVPSGVSAASGTATGQIFVDWTAAARAQSYLVQRSVSSGIGYATQAATSDTSYTDGDPTLTAGRDYYYEIAATNISGTSAFSAPAFAVPYVPPTFTGWAYTFFGLNAPANQSAETATPANDGITNLMKYALGLSPTIAFAGTASGLPVTGLATSGSNQYLTLTFTGTSPGVGYTVEATGNLNGPWTTLQSWPAGSPPGTQTVTDTAPVSSASRRFIRLRVVGP